MHTIAPFITERTYEQIKLDFGYQKLGINIVSVGGAFDYSQLGCTHHCYSDVSILSHLSDSNIVVPGSATEFNSIFKQIYKNGKINYYKIPEVPHETNIEDNIIFGNELDTILKKSQTGKGGSGNSTPSVLPNKSGGASKLS